MIAEVELVNFGPFGGKHVLRLGPGAHAIVARYEGVAQRSNGAGKTSLLEAVRFAATGELNRSRGHDADGWRTRGAREGSARITLVDGSWIERSKKAGQSTQVRAKVPGRELASQDAASEAFLKHLGLDAGDFGRAAFVEQKRSSAILSGTPEENLATVSSWLGLDLAERAEKLAQLEAKTRWSEVERLGSLRLAAEQVARRDPPPPLDDARRAVAEIEALVDKLSAEVARDRLAAERETAVRELAELADRGVLAADALAKLEKNAVDPKPLEDAADEARAALREAEAERKRRLVVARGEFDGRCPVAEIACPAREKINADRAAAAILHERAEKAVADARKRSADADEALARSRRERSAIERARVDVAHLREAWRSRKAALPPKADAPDDDPEERAARLNAAHDALEDARLEARDRERRADDLARAEADLADAKAKLAEAERRHTVASRAGEIFRLARRRVAECALGDVEAAANEAIEAAGVELRVSVAWERELKKPADECRRCGAPFPSSRRAKECARCGEARGLAARPGLEFVVSDRSGGYDDLAGAALQVAAGSWLLGRRESPWATAMLDEPTAALDPAVRAGLVRYLAGPHLGAYRQVLLVSHSPDVVAAMPSRIVVVVGRGGERRIEAG